MTSCAATTTIREALQELLAEAIERRDQARVSCSKPAWKNQEASTWADAQVHAYRAALAAVGPGEEAAG